MCASRRRYTQRQIERGRVWIGPRSLALQHPPSDAAYPSVCERAPRILQECEQAPCAPSPRAAPAHFSKFNLSRHTPESGVQIYPTEFPHTDELVPNRPNRAISTLQSTNSEYQRRTARRVRSSNPAAAGRRSVAT